MEPRPQFRPLEVDAYLSELVNLRVTSFLDLSQTHPNTDLLTERLMVRPGNHVAVRVRNRSHRTLPILLDVLYTARSLGRHAILIFSEHSSLRPV